MNSSRHSRRSFLRTTAGVLAAGWVGSGGLGPNRAAGDVVTQHRSVSTCHLVNISIRVGRKLT